MLEGQGYHEGLQGRFFGPDGLKALKVCSQSLCPAPDGTQLAEKVGFAKIGSMKPARVYGVVVTEEEVIPTFDDPV